MKDQASDMIKGSHSQSEHVRKFLDGSVRSAVVLNSAVIGYGTYYPGWKWSLHAGAQTGKASENHIGYILSGRMMVQSASGIEMEVGPGEAFEIGPNSDAWIIGDAPCIALDFIPT
jgi:quercetin dioxygenase-like cupin family protein